MEARTEFRGAGISRSLVAVVAVSITLALGVTAGVAAKNLSAAVAPQTHISQGLGGAAQANPAYRGGNQLVGGSAAPAPTAPASTAGGPDDRPSTSQQAAPVRVRGTQIDPHI